MGFPNKSIDKTADWAYIYSKRLCMNDWSGIEAIINKLPPVLATVLVSAAFIIFILGFTKRGFNFLKYGFGKIGVDETMGKRFDQLDARLDKMESDIGDLLTELVTVKTNHFGHLKGFLTELTSILLDKDVINNTDKARLDNQLRNM